MLALISGVGSRYQVRPGTRWVSLRSTGLSPFLRFLRHSRLRSCSSQPGAGAGRRLTWCTRRRGGEREGARRRERVEALLCMGSQEGPWETGLCPGPSDWLMGRTDSLLEAARDPH
jgi:hypothetical protein